MGQVLKFHSLAPLPGHLLLYCRFTPFPPCLPRHDDHPFLNCKPELTPLHCFLPNIWLQHWGKLGYTLFVHLWTSGLIINLSYCAKYSNKSRHANVTSIIFLWICAQKRNYRSYDSSSLISWGISLSLFWCCPNSHCHQECMRHLLSWLDVYLLCDNSILTEVRWCQTVFFTYISILINEVGHFWISLLANWISSLRNSYPSFGQFELNYIFIIEFVKFLTYSASQCFVRLINYSDFPYFIGLS